jgi:hemoglobin-like flavoprotein
MATAAQIVSETWATLRDVAAFSESFYERLLTIRPDYKRTLFKHTNIKVQAKMIRNMLNMAIENLGDPTALVPMLQSAGLRHCMYGVRHQDYEAGGEALVWALEHFLGRKFTPEVEAAWVSIYATIHSVMGGQCDTFDGTALLEHYWQRHAKEEAGEAAVRAQSHSKSGVVVVAAAVAVACVAVAAVYYCRAPHH